MYKELWSIEAVKDYPLCKEIVITINVKLDNV